MAICVTIFDKTVAGARTPAMRLDLLTSTITLREMLRRRACEEAQYERALQAFARNGFFVLVGDRQVEDLDEDLELEADTEVSFVKLVALVGG